MLGKAIHQLYTLTVFWKENFPGASVGGPGGEAWAQKTPNGSQRLQDQASETLMQPWCFL